MKKEKVQDKRVDFLQLIAAQYERLETELTPTDRYGNMVEVPVVMRDGIKLNTRVYFPASTGPWPVILERSPYPQMKQLTELTSKQFTKYGYVVVSQECRGKGDSEGEWLPFENERNDGIDTLQWIVKQSWMNGNIAMYGLSYGGFEQWIVADQLPKEVKTLFIGVFGTERYRQMYMNGMFRHEIYTSWAIENAGVPTEAEPGEVYQQTLRIRPHINMDSTFFGQEFPWYRNWITNVSQSSEFWQNGIWSKLSSIPKDITVPLYLVGGWYDHHLDGMVCGYENLTDEVKRKSRFVIGPWIHTLQPGGDLTYPNSEYISLIEAVKWFNHHLKGDSYDHPKGVVESYIIRENKWKVWEGGIKSREINKVYFNTNSSPDNQNFTLSYTQPEPNKINYLYDPSNPVKTKGGEALLAWISPGFNGAAPSSVLQEPVGLRSDVCSFVSSVLEEDMKIVGTIKVHLRVSTNAEDTSFTVKISEQFPDGNSYNIRDGITSISYRNGAIMPQDYSQGEVVDLEIELWPITWSIKAGSKLRVDISSSNFPAYHLHPNIKGNWASEERFKLAEQKIHLGEGTFLEIPIQ